MYYWMNIRGSLLTNGGTYWYLKRKPNLDKPELNIDPPAERFVVSLRSVFSIKIDSIPNIFNLAMV